jgi:hypothetical protein
MDGMGCARVFVYLHVDICLSVVGACVAMLPGVVCFLSCCMLAGRQAGRLDVGGLAMVGSEDMEGMPQSQGALHVGQHAFYAWFMHATY